MVAGSAAASPAFERSGVQFPLRPLFFSCRQAWQCGRKTLHTAGIEPATPGLRDLRANHYAAC